MNEFCVTFYLYVASCNCHLLRINTDSDPFHEALSSISLHVYVKHVCMQISENMHPRLTNIS